LKKISESAREVIDSLSAIVWSLNPRNDGMDNLVGYLREYASEILEATPINGTFDFPAEIPTTSLSAEARRNIFLTMKEAINNTIKHSGATCVKISLSIASGRLRITIEDDGRGFVLEDLSQHGNGLANMRKRIEEIGGTFAITSQHGKGTAIHLSVPVS
jgi:signal transduction histidine kinase